MAYEIIYQAEFDNVAENRYRVEILKKDYSGPDFPIFFGGIPVQHSWQTDEPKAAIKGSSLTVGLLTNEVTTEVIYNISSLYLDDSGGPHILIADDYFIPVINVPFTISGHPDALANGTWTPISVLDLGGGNWDAELAPGAFTGSTSPAAAVITLTETINISLLNFYSEEDDTFKCRFYEEGQLKFEGFLVQDDCNELMADYVNEISLSFNDNLGLLKDVILDIPVDRVVLMDAIAECISKTGLELEIFIYANIFEDSHSTSDCFLAQTVIDTQTFIKNETFDNCYGALTSILERFNLTLFQANGTWNIVRWDEIRYDINVPYFQYDSAFNLLGTGTLDADFTTGFNQDVYPGTELIRSIFRPFKYAKETFHYVQPKYLLRNFDLQNLGALRTSYTSGSNTMYEYDFTDWFASGFGTAPDFFIRVVKDTATGDEVDRYVVIEGPTGDNPRSVVATPFEVNEGDSMTFDFTYKTTKSQVGPGTTIVAIRLFDGSTTQYATGDPGTGWKTGLGWVYAISSGDDTANSQSVSIRTGKIPYSGLIYIYLPHADLTAGAGDETQIKDIRVTYTPYINDSIKIIGHVHKTEQSITIKNNDEEEIYIDDSPRNSVIGTLFRSSFTGLLQDRTSEWYRLSNSGERLRIGEITTLEQLFWRRKPRTKLEGTYYGVLGISMLAVLKNVAFNELNFIFGSLEIDYKNNNLNCTMWEVFEDGEVDGDLTADYTFTYLYDSK